MEASYSSYEKGLLLKLTGKSILDFIKYVGLKPKDNISLGEDSLWITEKKTRVIPNKYLSSRVPDNQNGWYTYEIYILSITVNIDSYIFISCPHPKLLDEINISLSSLSPIFVACDLISLCKTKFHGEDESFLYIRRMNAQVLGEENKKAVSIGLFGRDVLKSDTIKKILEIKVLDHNKNETSHIFFSKILIPNSVRLTYDDGTDRKDEEFSLNTDKFGNYSFFLRSLKDFDRVLYTFKFLHSKNCLHRELLESPLKRNEQAIKYVE